MSRLLSRKITFEFKSPFAEGVIINGIEQLFFYIRGRLFCQKKKRHLFLLLALYFLFSFPGFSRDLNTLFHHLKDYLVAKLPGESA